MLCNLNQSNRPAVDGFRVDAVKHVPKAFWSEFESKVNTYTIGEDFTSQTEYICNYMINAVSAVLNYPMWYSIMNTFKNSSTPVQALTYAINNLDTTCHDPTIMGIFTENHDVARLANMTDDLSHLKNALVFGLLGDGIPILYYGTEQRFHGGEDPGNREALWLSGYNTSAPLYQLVKQINWARNAIVGNATYDYWSPYWTHKTKAIVAHDDVLVMRKGYDKSLVTVITNKGSNADDIGPFEIGDTNFHAGAQIVDVTTCKTKTTGDAGVFSTTLTDGEPQVRNFGEKLWRIGGERETANSEFRFGFRRPTSTAPSLTFAPTSRSRPTTTTETRRRADPAPRRTLRARRRRRLRPPRPSPAAWRYSAPSSW